MGSLVVVVVLVVVVDGEEEEEEEEERRLCKMSVRTTSETKHTLLNFGFIHTTTRGVASMIDDFHRSPQAES